MPFLGCRLEIYALQPYLYIGDIVLPADTPMMLSWACRPAPDTRDCQARRPQRPIFGTAKPGHRHVNSAVSPAQRTMISCISVRTELLVFLIIYSNEVSAALLYKLAHFLSAGLKDGHRSA